ncbi:MAG: nucleoside triphosphate pyrophosphohydrolase [Alphaproteobacteria bacterium]|nr:nucleoside triphosphate pyrophosphohydrolase [Alphaproteobacteria bacterium]
MSSNTDRLIAVMARLRDPNGGCPWDLTQNFTTIAPYTIEEAYEVAEAIRLGDMGALKEELGDLLLQVAYHAQMAHETGAFDFEAVAGAIADKMIRRHPHVFADATIESASAQTRAWEDQKASERGAKAEPDGKAPSVLSGVALALPALLRAEKLQKRAARVGFDWPEVKQVFDKIDEELAEIRHAIDHPPAEPAARLSKLHDELGDLLFACANLARHLKVDPEDALRGTNAKFERRFRFIEAALAKVGRTPSDATLDEMEALWQEGKKAE